VSRPWYLGAIRSRFAAGQVTWSSFRAVWWTDDKKNRLVNCAPFVKRYLDKRTPKEDYRPYVISGQAVGEPANIVMKSIDPCAPKAAHFGVPEANVFR
jgi:hypothetical protein